MNDLFPLQNFFIFNLDVLILLVLFIAISSHHYYHKHHDFIKQFKFVNNIFSIQVFPKKVTRRFLYRPSERVGERRHSPRHPILYWVSTWLLDYTVTCLAALSVCIYLVVLVSFRYYRLRTTFLPFTLPRSSNSEWVSLPLRRWAAETLGLLHIINSATPNL